jgi:undecaprenyl-diphosphatase
MMGWFVIIGSLPIILLGLALQDLIDREFRNLWVIGTTLVVLGVVLGIAERVGRKSSPIESMTMRHAVLLGLAQAGALVPGVSRSGATISMGLFLGYERAAATRYAFLLAIPAVLGAGIYKLKDIPGGENAYGVGPTIVGTIVSFVVGIAVIHWLLKFVSTRSYAPFVVYRVALGTLVLFLVGFGVISATTTVG